MSELRVTLELAGRFSELAVTRPGLEHILTGERLAGISEHFIGDLPRAREHLEHVLANIEAPMHGSRCAVGFGFDPRVTAHAHLARVLWLMGFPDQAVANADVAVDLALKANHPISLCYALGEAACQIALWLDDLVAAEQHAETLVEVSTRFGLPASRPVGRMYLAGIMVHRGDTANGVARLRAGLLDQVEPLYAWARAVFLRELAEGLVHAGLLDEALAVIRQRIDRCEHTEENWPMAEYLRLHGEVLARLDPPDVATSADYFRRAMDWSRRQGALAFELRAATGLARLPRAREPAAEVRQPLATVIGRFSEGFETPDLRAGRHLLDARA